MKLFLVQTIEQPDIALDSFKYNIGYTTSSFLSYHDALIDINSVKERILGTRIVRKGNQDYVLSDSGSLIAIHSKEKTEDYQDAAFKVKQLQSVTEYYGGHFLYCAVPNKEVFEQTPVNCFDYSADNYLGFINALYAENICCLDFFPILSEFGAGDNYFHTDHHWKPNAGFLAYKFICEKLFQQYGFDYHQAYCDISLYQTKIIPQCYLGSYGRKLGRFFGGGLDDFELILPQFDTYLTLKQPYLSEERTGFFEESVLFLNKLSSGSIYQNVSYDVYGGGNDQFKIILNHKDQGNKKILLICDSFACLVYPFLSLQVSELHILDMRHFYNYVDEKISVESYIQEIKPDYVLCLYNGTGKNGDSRFHFFE